MEVKDYITIIGIGLTFIASASSLFISFRNSRKIAFINSITSSRMRWIDEIRNDISEFCGFITHYRLTDDLNYEVTHNLYEQIDILAYKINLRLNRNDSLDILIINKIELILENIESDNKIAENEMDELIELTQDLLKFEWERVKSESINGMLSEKQKNVLLKKFIKDIPKS